MKSAHSRKGEFRNVGENLCRYSSNGVYYARFRINGKLIHRSLNTTDREFAKRLLKEEISKAGRIDQKLATTPLSELLRLYDERLDQYAPKTVATRKSILKIFKETWKFGFDVPVKKISTGQIELWLASRRAKMKNATYNEYARFVRHVFGLGVKLRVLSASPAAEIKGLRVEAPLRTTPTWDQFQAIVANIRSQKFSDTAEDSADLVEFMGLAGGGTAECANLKGDKLSDVVIVAYMRLIDSYWRDTNCDGLEADDEELQRICRASDADFVKIKDKLFTGVRYFTLDEGHNKEARWQHNRIRAEWDYSVKVSEGRSKGGKIAAEIKRIKKSNLPKREEVKPKDE